MSRSIVSFRPWSFTATLAPGALLAGLILASATGCGSFAAQGMNAEGVRLFDQANYQEAIQHFQQAIFEDPNNADAYYNLASAYHRLGTKEGKASDLAQAERYYNQCLDHAPNHRECHRGLAVLLLQQGRSAEAFRLLEGWVDKHPASAEPKIELARLSEETGDREAAKQHLVDALRVDERNPRALAALGRVREQLGETREALLAYQRSLWLDRFQPEVQARLAALQTAVSPQPLTTGLPTLTAQPPANLPAGLAAQPAAAPTTTAAAPAPTAPGATGTTTPTAPAGLQNATNTGPTTVR